MNMRQQLEYWYNERLKNRRFNIMMKWIYNYTSTALGTFTGFLLLIIFIEYML